MSQEASGLRLETVLGAVMLALMALELLDLYVGIPAVSIAAKVLVLSLPVLAWRRLRLREFYLIAICFLLLGLLWSGESDTAETLKQALDRSAYLASFILLMGLLREGAVTSRSVLECGTYVTVQPSRRRFLGVFAGSHFFSVLINLGSLSLLAPIIQRGVRGERDLSEPLDEIARVRERRQLSAALRGFAWFLVWAPTAVTQAILPTLIPGIDPLRLIAIGAVVTLVMLAVGWIEDTVTWAPLRRRLQAEGRMPETGTKPYPTASARNLALVCAGLFSLTILFTLLGKVSIVSGVMLAAPIIVIGWIFAQQRRFAPDERTTRAKERLGTIAFTALPGFIREAVFIGCAGFIGTTAARLVPVADIAAALGIAGIAPWLVMTGLSVLVWSGGQVGLSPITMAVFLGSVVAELQDLPVDPTLAALAIAAGTAICSVGAPFASGTLMLSRASGYSGFELTWKWNSVYTALCVVALAALYAIFTAVGI